jgi:4'-phosphopantetheinyl transferase EntD
MLPLGVCVAAGPALATPLTARESASLGTVDIHRAREFESGRAYAKRALHMLGVDNVDLPIGPSCSPLWPSGVVGSITHVRYGDGGLYVGAAVARAHAVLAMGIDFEMADGLHPDVWPHVLTQREFEGLLACPIEDRRIEAQYIWCAKEATAKIVKERLDPSRVQVERDPRSGDFLVSFMDGRRRLQGGFVGRTARLDGLLIATAVLLPS